MSHAPQASGAIIESDITCVSCGYNLRSLTAEGRCPECGAPVEASLSDEAQQEYGKGRQRRVQLIVASIFNGFLLYFSLACSGGCVWIVLTREPLTKELRQLGIIFIWFVILAGLLWAPGFFLTFPVTSETWAMHGLAKKRAWLRFGGLLYYLGGMGVILLCILVQFFIEAFNK